MDSLRILSGFLIVLFFMTSFQAFSQQTPVQRSVLLSAQTEETSSTIQLNWEEDLSASYYKVYRKSPDANSWGTPLAVLPATAISYLDQTVGVGEAYEYAVFKKEFDQVVDTVCVSPGADLKFTVTDMYGIGLCCSFGFGSFAVEACDSTYASGDDFGFTTSSTFSVCDNGDSCVNLIVRINPDLFPNSTSWILEDNQSGAIVARSGEVGEFIDLRPAYGYMLSGMKVPPIEERGTLLLLLEDRLEAPLIAEIIRLELDLVTDGWKVLRRTVNAQDEVTDVRALIQDLAQQNTDLEALFILGHVPVPYSGDIYPDTHTEHRGAWAADTYYGELNGNWTDDRINRATAFFAYNHNIPGDGKFDQDSIPSKMELQVGRVDFHNMPAFADNDIELTRKYLQKNHLFRNGGISAQRRGLIDDNFGVAFGGPAASGWRNFSVMFGPENIDELDFFSTLRNESYLWSYGCGPGTHISSQGVGSTDEYAADSLLTIFSMNFGSQFGDWDNVNNYLRAPLASGLTLTNCWAGNPPWNLHHMALGYHIGHSARLTQNSADGLYLNGPQLVHTALMGDPSLRMHVVRPVDVLLTNSTGQTVELRWPASSEVEIAGYHIYRASSLTGDFERITTTALTSTEYVDTDPLDGNNVYMLRVMKLETSASGSYYNLSQGRVDSLEFERLVGLNPLPENVIRLHPNPSKGDLQLSFDRLPSGEYRWRVLSVSGKHLLEKTGRHSSRTESIDLRTLPEGIYIFEYLNEGISQSQKIVIQR